MGRAVATLGLLVAPFPGLRVEVVEVMEDAAREKVVLYILEGLFDLSLSLAVALCQGEGRVAVVQNELLEESLEDDSVLEARDDHLLHPVVENLMGDAAGLLECHHVAVANAVDVGVGQEVDEMPAAEAEDHREADNLGWRLAEGQRVRGKIHLSLLAGLGLEPLVGPAA